MNLLLLLYCLCYCFFFQCFAWAWLCDIAFAGILHLFFNNTINFRYLEYCYLKKGRYPSPNAEPVPRGHLSCYGPIRTVATNIRKEILSIFINLKFFKEWKPKYVKIEASMSFQLAHENDVVSTSMRRDYVASASIRRHV